MNDHESRDRILKAALAHQSALTAYAYAMLSDYPAAQDVVQNTFVVVARKYEDFEEGTSMLAWCRTIVRLQVLSYIRKNRRELPVEDRVLQDAMDAAFAKHQSDEDTPYRVDCLRECLSRLPQNGREIIRLRYEENAAYPEIGKALSITLETVRKRLFRTKQQLGDCVRLRMTREPSA
ncbi:MAG: sigma-70 family RNA polymerase sigma factor [Phycisphaera sp.]|nr:sigma-70 family RNA polymerase sigma factor [Phycisphaera sp.]